MITSKTNQIQFLQNYGEILHAFTKWIRTKKLDYIIAMPRKAPRPLELCHNWSLDLGESPIITDKAIKFGVSLEGKKKN